MKNKWAAHRPRSAESIPLSVEREGVGMVEERLPFTVKIVSSNEELHKAVRIRQAAYARHDPEHAARLTNPEPFDYDPGAAVLLAESKLDGSALGTMRVQTNRFQSLFLEQSVVLPDWLLDRRLATASRLCALSGHTKLIVKRALFKACYQYCLFTGVEWIVVAGRAPLDRQYEELLFRDVYPNLKFIPFKHVENIPHRVLARKVATWERDCATAQHPLFDYNFRTYHPDIDLTGGNFTLWEGLTQFPKTKIC